MNESPVKMIRQQWPMMQMAMRMLPTQGMPWSLKLFRALILRTKLLIATFAAVVIASIASLVLSFIIVWYIAPSFAAFLFIATTLFGLNGYGYFKKLKDPAQQQKMMENMDVNAMMEELMKNPEALAGMQNMAPKATVRTIPADDPNDRRARAAKYIDPPKET